MTQHHSNQTFVKPGTPFNIDDPMLTTIQTSAMTGVAKGTLEFWRWERKGPKFVKMGRAVRYRKSDVEAWMAEMTVDTSEGE